MRFLPLAALVLAAGCYQIDADVTGLTASAGQESFDGAGAAAGQAMAIDRMFSFDGAGALAATLKKARIDSITLTPAGGVASLDFLSSLTLVLHAPAGDVPLVDAAGKMTGADGSVTLPIAIDVDPALLSAPLPIEASLRFVAPATAWSMRADAVLTVQGHADLHP